MSPPYRQSLTPTRLRRAALAAGVIAAVLGGVRVEKYVRDFRVHGARALRICVAGFSDFRAQTVTPLEQDFARHQFLRNQRRCARNGRGGGDGDKKGVV